MTTVWGLRQRVPEKAHICTRGQHRPYKEKKIISDLMAKKTFKNAFIYAIIKRIDFIN